MASLSHDNPKVLFIYLFLILHILENNMEVFFLR